MSSFRRFFLLFLGFLTSLQSFAQTVPQGRQNLDYTSSGRDGRYGADGVSQSGTAVVRCDQLI